jgi:uncharacterized protein (DUF302 family)
MDTSPAKRHNYGFKRTIDLGFSETLSRTREALMQEGFGVLSEIKLDEKLREKLVVQFRHYVILGACNPTLAYEMLGVDIDVGLLLPCNVVVYESDEPGKTVVAAIDALAMIPLIGDNPAATAAAKEVSERLKRVLDLI